MAVKSKQNAYFNVQTSGSFRVSKKVAERHFSYHQLTRAHKPERLVLGRSCVLVACITSSSTALLGLGSPSKQAL